MKFPKKLTFASMLVFSVMIWVSWGNAHAWSGKTTVDPSDSPITANIPLPEAPTSASDAAPVAAQVAAKTPPAQAEPATEPAEGSNPNPPAAGAESENDWPRVVNSGNQQLTIYQPQVESWKNNLLKQRAAVSIQESNQAENGQTAEGSGDAQNEPVFGVIWISARTEVDKASGMVSLNDVQVTKASFPSETSKNAELKTLFQDETASTLGPMSLEHLQANLIVTHAEEKNTVSNLKNTAPKIFYSSTPASLILIDGDPSLRDTSAENILRVINTRALLLVDRSHGKAYLYAGDEWMIAPTADGPFEKTDQQKIESLGLLNQARNEATAQKQVDTLDDLKGQISEGYKIYASTTPAELIQTKGTAQFEPLAATHLLYAKNSGDDIFLDTADQKYYVLLSGRWYRAPALNSDWTYVAQKSLPKDFANIPVTHPKGDVLASVAGTPQAKEAVISNTVPQTATIERNPTEPLPPVQYDGAPQFAPIEGTPLQYVVNSRTPIIMVNPDSFYSVQNGIWFSAPTPTGPWEVATQVPRVIYRIPPSSPLYYVTYVYVYGYTPRYVYVGYLPGYMGSYVTPDGVVVYGTGYYYHPWIGHAYWYGPPVTFGFGVAWGVGYGWGFHFGSYGGYYAGPAVRPWWGPWYNHPYYGGPAYGGGPVTVVNINRTNVYHSWAATRPGFVQPLSINRGEQARAGYPGTTFAHAGARPGMGMNTLPQARPGGLSPGRYTPGGRPGATRPIISNSNPNSRGAAPAARANNVYADHSGNVYRHTSQGGWQHYQGNHTWNPTQTKSMEPDRSARALGQQRYNMNQHPSALHAGEGHAGFGGGHTPPNSPSFHHR